MSDMTEAYIQQFIEIALDGYRKAVQDGETNPILFILKDEGGFHTVDVKGDTGEARRKFLFETGKIAKDTGMKPHAIVFLSEAFMVMKHLQDGESPEKYKNLLPSKDPDRQDVFILVGETADGRFNTYTEEVLMLDGGKRNTRPISIKGEEQKCPQPFFSAPLSETAPAKFEKPKSDDSLTNAFWEGYRA